MNGESMTVFRRDSEVLVDDVGSVNIKPLLECVIIGSGWVPSVCTKTGVTNC